MIVALAGRRIDPANADYKRFPLSAVPEVKRKLKEFFRDEQVTHLVSSGACGADLVSQEVASELSVARTIILPFDPETFRKTSVIDRPGDWGKIYDKLVGDVVKSNRLINLNYPEDDEQAYDKTNIELLNTTEGLSTSGDKIDIVVLIVWEGRSRGEGDSTYGLMQAAKRRSLQTREIRTL